MAINLVKGQRVKVELSKVLVGLGWNPNKYSGGFDFDLDASAFMLNASDKVTNDNDLVFYHNLKHPSGSVIHMGDDLVGKEIGDAEQILIDLKKVPSTYTKIAIAVTIYDPVVRKQNFGQVSNSYLRIINNDNDEEIYRFDLGEDFSVETGVLIGEFYRDSSNTWKFNAIGGGVKFSLEGFCTKYGIDVGRSR